MSTELGGFRYLGNSTYQKWDNVMGIRTTVRFEGTGDKKIMHVRHEQPKQIVQDILDLNVARQNGFSSFKSAEMHMTSSIPLTVHSQIMEKCGNVPGIGYDEKKFKQILNDRDYYKLKTVPGRI